MRGAAALALALLALPGCREKRKPLPRGDGGPAVVLLDGRAPDLGLAAAMASEVEPNDARAQATTLPSNTRLGGALALGPKDDVDWFVIPPFATQRDLGAIDAGEPATVAFVTLSAASEPIALDVADDKGRSLATRRARPGQPAHFSYLVIGDSPTLLRLRRAAQKPSASDAAYTLEYTSRLAAPGEEHELDDDAPRANAAPAAGVATGRLDGTEDRDLWSLGPMHVGGTYRIEVAGLPELSLELKVRSGSEQLAAARASKGAELRMRNVPAEGAQPIIVTVRAVDGVSDLDYQLRIASEPPLDASMEREPNDDRAHANAIDGRDSVDGYLWPGDVDWYCSAGDKALGAQVDALTDVDWKIESFGADGKSVAKVDAGKRGASETLAADPRARCIRLSAHVRDTAFDVPYHLSFLTGGTAP